VAEIEVTNLTPYDKEYVPAAMRRLPGRRQIHRSRRRGAALYGEPPKGRIAIMVFENMERQRPRSILRPIGRPKGGDQYAKFRIYAVEGLPQ
jgi:hypothetical protein